MFTEIILHSDEVKGGGNKDDGVHALHRRFKDRRKNLCREVLKSPIGFIGRTCTIKMVEILNRNQEIAVCEIKWLFTWAKPAGTSIGLYNLMVRIFPATFFKLMYSDRISGVS